MLVFVVTGVCARACVPARVWVPACVPTGACVLVCVIAVSETWLEKDEGYELFTVDRTYSKSGGVAIYVDSALRCNMLSSMSTTIEGIMECVTLEIHVADSKNIIISCVYRTPGSCLDTFNQKLNSISGNVKKNKVHILTCDFNVDLLNLMVMLK